jgi:hypothetical protein
MGGKTGVTDIRAALLRTARARGPGKSFCPSDVARDLADDWRPLMPVIRSVATDLQQEGRLTATQKGQAVDVATARGPIRLSLPSGPRESRS